MNRILLLNLNNRFWDMQSLCLKSGAVSMQVAFGRVRRKTAPTGHFLQGV